MWSPVSNEFLTLLLERHNALDGEHHIRWDLVHGNPILLHHVVHHIIHCCRRATFIPKQVSYHSPSLMGIAIVTAFSLAIPVKTESSRSNTLQIFEQIPEALPALNPDDLAVALLLARR